MKRLMLSVMLILIVAFAGSSLSAQTVLRPAPSASQSPDTQRPRLADSATGYIDNAIVGSQIRIRLDSGFGVNAPDRAEFFYGKCGCYRFAPQNSAVYDPNAPGPGGPGQVEDSLYFQELRVDAEYAYNGKLSFLAEIPARVIEPSVVPRTVGIADMRLGAKYAVIADDVRYVTGQFRLYTPTGNARKGLGTDHYAVEPSILYHQRVTNTAAIAGEFGLWHPIGGSAGVPTASDEKFAGNVLVYGAGVSFDAFENERLVVSPVVEFIGWNVLGGFQTATNAPPSADGVRIANIKIGARLSSPGGSSVYIGLGKAVTDAVWYKEIFRMEYRYAF